MMMISNIYLMIFAVAMTGCVLATPLVTWIATWVGAIDRPDQFRRIHQGAIPRLGGLALALGVAAGTILTQLHEPLSARAVGEFGAAASLVAAPGGARHPDRRVHRRHAVARPADEAAGPGTGGPDALPGRHPDPDDRRARPELRPGVSRRAVQPAGISRRAGAPQPAGHAVLVPGLHECLEPDRRHGRARLRRGFAGQRDADSGGDPQRELRGRGAGRRAGGQSRGVLAV